MGNGIGEDDGLLGELSRTARWIIGNAHGGGVARCDLRFGKSDGGASASGSGDGSKTGQDTTVLFIMLGVMIVAAGAIVIIRRKSRS